MSRIDKAIELAAQQRQNAPDPAPESNAVTEKQMSPVQPSAPMAPKVTNAKPAAASDSGSQYKVFSAVPVPVIRNPFLVTANSSTAPVAEQYRKLKSIIVKLTQLDKFDKSLMVTSSIGGEGKTLTSLNLAITLAQEFDHTVLLVEADIRRPTVMKYLEMESSIGLTDCALDDIDVSEALVKTGIGNLSILPAGRPVPNPVELFSSKRMQNLLLDIKTRYSDRYVIIDTTPLLPFAEPQYIANAVGGVIFVVREGYTSIDKVKRALSLLENHNLLGVVCNGVSKVHSGGKNGYYGYYGYK
jgi:exopolysaccharide/PEP-CTERM locus tyrosine autokinase